MRLEEELRQLQDAQQLCVHRPRARCKLHNPNHRHNPNQRHHTSHTLQSRVHPCIGLTPSRSYSELMQRQAKLSDDIERIEQELDADNEGQVRGRGMMQLWV